MLQLQENENLSRYRLLSPRYLREIVRSLKTNDIIENTNLTYSTLQSFYRNEGFSHKTYIELCKYIQDKLNLRPE